MPVLERVPYRRRCGDGSIEAVGCREGLATDITGSHGAMFRTAAEEAREGMKPDGKSAQKSLTRRSPAKVMRPFSQT